MATRMSVLLGSALSVVLVVVGLRAWSQAADLTVNAARPDVAAWAVRSGAVALIALAQVVCYIWVVGKLYRPHLMDDIVKLLSFTVTAVSIVAAVALGLASR